MKKEFRYGRMKLSPFWKITAVFKDVKVPKDNLLGEEGKGFYYMMESLPKERLSIAAGSIEVIDFVLE